MRFHFLLFIMTTSLLTSGCNKTESYTPPAALIALAATASKADSANPNSQGAQENLKYIQKKLIDAGVKAIILRPPYSLQTRQRTAQTNQSFTPVIAGDYLPKVKAFAKINKTAAISHLITLDMQAGRRELGRRYALQIRFSATITPIKGSDKHTISPRERQIGLSASCQNYCLDQMILTQTRPIQDQVTSGILAHLGIKSVSGADTSAEQKKTTAPQKAPNAPVPEKSTTVSEEQLASLSYNMEVVGLTDTTYKALTEELQSFQKFRALTLVTYKAAQNRYILRYGSGLSVIDLRAALSASLNKLGVQARVEIYGSLIILDAR